MNILQPFKTYKIQEIITRAQQIGIRPLDVMITGVSGAGKSTTINKIFSQEVAKVGRGVDPETMDLTSYSLNDHVRFWDTPGLGDGVQKDKIHSERLIELLNHTYVISDHHYGFIDMVLVVIEGLNRDMGTIYRLINDIITPNIQSDRILVAINQCDVVMKGRGWENNAPNSMLLDFLDKQAFSVQKRVYEATGHKIPMPIFYSAEYNYNLDVLYNFLIHHMPTTKRVML